MISRDRENRHGESRNEHERAADAGQRPPATSQQRRCPRDTRRSTRRNSRGRRQRWIVGQYRPLELLQALAGLEPELLGERAPSLVVEAQSVRLSAGAVQREHELTARPLPQRVLGDETLQLGNDVSVATESQLGIEPLLHGA